MAKLDAEKTFSFIYFFLISRYGIILYIFVALVHQWFRWHVKMSKLLKITLLLYNDVMMCISDCLASVDLVCYN